MKYIPLLFALLFSSQSFAQKGNTFLLEGNIKNFTSQYVEFGTTGFFKSTRSSILVDKKGKFSRKIFLDGVQDIRMLVNNEMFRFSATPGDTINLSWDQKAVNNTLQIKSPSPARDKELQLQLSIHKERYKPFMGLMQKLASSNELTDSTKFKLINDSYNAEMALIFASTGISDENPKAFYDNYFKHATLLASSKLLTKFTLKTDEKYFNPKYTYFTHTNLSAECFRLSNTYRDFIFNMVRFHKPFYYINSDEASGNMTFDPARSEYLLGQANIDIPLIRDWYLAYSLMSSFSYYQFSNVKPLYDDYIKSGAKQDYIDTVKTFYGNFSKLKPGLPAPEFTLNDANGKSVSLSDFRGKLVYIDFWGVYCGPCLSDTTENATKVHDKYKNNDVVFMNICVDEVGDVWKNKIKALKLEGINLVAAGRTNNPVSKEYNITGIPHYVIIDREGNLVNNNADPLWGLNGEKENMLDKALKL